MMLIENLNWDIEMTMGEFWKQKKLMRENLNIELQKWLLNLNRF